MAVGKGLGDHPRIQLTTQAMLIPCPLKLGNVDFVVHNRTCDTAANSTRRRSLRKGGYKTNRLSSLIA